MESVRYKMRKIFLLVSTLIVTFTMVSCSKNSAIYIINPEFDVVTCGSECLFEEGTESIRWIDNQYRQDSDFNYDAPDGFAFNFFFVAPIYSVNFKT